MDRDKSARCRQLIGEVLEPRGKTWVKEGEIWSKLDLILTFLRNALSDSDLLLCRRPWMTS